MYLLTTKMHVTALLYWWASNHHLQSQGHSKFRKCSYILVITKCETLSATNVYWIVHHCNSWGIKNQLDVTCYLYFTYYLLNMFRTLICPSSGAYDCVEGLPHRLSCSVKTDVFAISVPLWCVMVRLVWCAMLPYCDWSVYFNWFWPLYVVFLCSLYSFVCGIFHWLFGI